MILLFLTLVPSLLWDEGPQSAPVLERAGIREIAVTGDPAAWANTKVQAVQVDTSKLEKLDEPTVDYQIGRGGATAAPWIVSNIWRMLKHRDRGYLYEVSGTSVPLAIAEAHAMNVRAYVKLKQPDLEAFARAVDFARDLDGEALHPRVNFALYDDGSDDVDEVMNLMVRRNLLFEAIRGSEKWNGTTVRIGTGGYTREMASDPYAFASVVRGRIGDDKRLVRLYGSETTLARLYGDERRARLHLIQYGRNPVSGLRIRVLGRYSRVIIAALGQRVSPAEDVVVDDTSTEFTIREFRNYAVVDLDTEAGVLRSVHSPAEFVLTADPAAPHWLSAPKVTIHENSYGQRLPIGPTEVRSRWTNDSLYLMYICPFAQLHLRSNRETDRETPYLWDWDVAEAFIGSDFDNIAQYREYQVSPQGEWVDLDIDVVNPKPQLGMPWNSGFEVKARIDKGRRIWYGEMKIPLSSISASRFKAGDQLRLGLYRCTGLPPDRLFAAWQPTFRRSFHVPEAFGTLVLQDAVNQHQSTR
jgi:hypothetical protein